MYPDLFSIGPLTLHTYGLFVALGFIAALLAAVHIGRTVGINAQQVMDMGFIMILWAIIGSRLGYLALNLSYYRNNLLDILKIWQGGLVFSGGLLTALLALLWHLRRRNLSFWKVGDLWAPAAALGQGIGRIGCFMAGCCYGKPAEVPWAVVFTHPKSLAPLHTALHPTQIYASLSGFVVFLILMFLHRRKRFQGQVLLWFLILHSTARLLIERFRGDDRGLIPGTDMSLTQLVTLVILLGSVVALLFLKSKMEKRDS
ncbi:MAG: prolipoprotein diacylglyceryl transferase [Deltaproteobacteria bacterium]|nr:prolipoprotein diacylglyceryl transferase [Deltaproteobacteria bacterium]